MIRELHQKIISQEISVTELTQEYLKIIKEKDTALKAFLDIYEKKPLQQAQALDERINQGEEVNVLAGIPYALKDNICVAGKRTSAASKMLANYIAPYDATVTKKIQAREGILLGKTNLDEFAMGSSTENSFFGESRNPWDKNRVPGGSSGGSAVAVASEMVAWALGSDTGGSIRQPAGLTGTVGFKPTYGRVSRYGLMAMASSYDQIGPITKTVDDARIIYQAIYGKDTRDNTTISKEETKLNKLSKKDLATFLKGKKIGIFDEFFNNDGLDEKIKMKMEERMKYAQQKGAQLIKIELPNFKHSLAVYYLMMASEVSSNLARLDGLRFGFNEALLEDAKSKNILDVYQLSRELALGDEVKRRIILGTYALSSGYYDAYYKKAQQIREVIKQELKMVFEKVDCIISPTTPTPAFKIGEKSQNPLAMYLTDIYTVGANVAMIPAISIPAGTVEKDGKELPVGLQLLGNWWQEDKLLNLAEALEVKI